MIGRVEVDSLSCAVNGKQILKNISLSLSAGDTVLLTGANGSGKTTLLKVVAGMLRPSAGRVTFAVSPAAPSKESPLRYPREDMGALIGDPVFYPGMTCRKTLEYHAAHFSQRVSVAETLERFDLTQQIDTATESLSAGQRMRLALARAWINSPSLLLLDEPENSLDAESKTLLVKILDSHAAEGRISLIVTHDPTMFAGVRHTTFMIDNTSVRERT
ncbi:heme ABC exporter ATP-binding protein CcmA [Canibacter sp. lx-72]|uniref:heme ABC exporter ATP-binding protein CcmA n=1 Tax=Canibacter zhuwentaonis TaxID=2837491 RepID=UPI001BDCD51C|nr:heme ABC exporter ATP-binding protein CcmA [Canibacter zhuwentaonis]MBT1018138.1 heme ABC exporter ATP-binding protein CcmA [Canibacter zhuwentaonis]MBT1035327.1 heme ABC exporter ATP-binding protein CcmA [Canibacter zhuwentaonis]